MSGAEQLEEPPADAEPQTTGRRERRRSEIRDRLFETAVELFLEQGYERTTMDDIGNRADVARTTVFNHYPRKSEFLNEWGARRRAKIASLLRRGHLDDKPIDVVLESSMQLLAEMNMAHRAETKVMAPAAVAFGDTLDNPPLADTFGNYVRRAQDRGQVRVGIDPHQAGMTLAATYFATLISWCGGEQAPFDLEDALRGVARLVLHGLEPTDAPANR